MSDLKLFMVLLGCKPPGRHTEQHDVFFGAGVELKDLANEINSFWPEAKGKLHIDAWKEVTQVDGYSVQVVRNLIRAEAGPRLFFVNLGGYRPGDFEEYHYKFLVAGIDKGMAIQKAKQTAFYRHFGFEGADSHIDDKYGVDVDDFYEIEDVLPASFKEYFSIRLHPQAEALDDGMHIGYVKLEKLLNS